MADVESLARANRVPWDQLSTDKLVLVEAIYLADLADKVKEEDAKRKRKKR